MAMEFSEKKYCLQDQGQNFNRGDVWNWMMHRMTTRIQIFRAPSGFFVSFKAETKATHEGMMQNFKGQRWIGILKSKNA